MSSSLSSWPASVPNRSSSSWTMRASATAVSMSLCSGTGRFRTSVISSMLNQRSRPASSSWFSMNKSSTLTSPCSRCCGRLLLPGRLRAVAANAGYRRGRDVCLFEIGHIFLPPGRRSRCPASRNTSPSPWAAPAPKGGGTDLERAGRRPAAGRRVAGHRRPSGEMKAASGEVRPDPGRHRRLEMGGRKRGPRR